MQGWFNQNPNPTGGLRDLSWDAHKMGRNLFASNFARGGFSRVMFARTGGEAFKSAFNTPYDIGSRQHVRNLEFMAAQNPDSRRIQNALNKARNPMKKSFARKALGGLGHAGMMGAFVALPAFTTEGGLPEKGRAVAGGLAGWAGFEIGSKAGAGIGAAIGSVIPGIGTAIGGVVGFVGGGLLGAIGGEEGFGAIMSIPDTMVERERKRRNLNWVGNRDAFNTQSAATMRQMSLQAMNRGMATGRSALGREAIMFHR